MSSNDSRRFILIGRQAQENQWATRYVRLPVTKFQGEPKDERLTTDEYTGSLMRETAVIRLFKHGEMALDVNVRTDLGAYLWGSTFQAPPQCCTQG